jgi:coenzyme F420 hydrogenase subunit beta
VEGRTEVSMADVNKMGISRGRFWVRSVDGNRFRVPVKFIKAYAQQSCFSCLDFCGELSDISIGSVGSTDGYSSVLVRSEKGKKVFSEFKNRIECNILSEEGLKAITNLASIKKSTNLKAIEKRKEKNLRTTPSL